MAELSTTIFYGDITVSNNQYVKGQSTIDGALTVNNTIYGNDIQKNNNTVATETWVSNNFNNYTDGDAITAINNDGDHGSTASHNYYTNSDVDSYLSGGTGISYSSGTISIDSTVATESWVSNNFYSSGDNPQFTNINVVDGDGNGLKFWSSDNYKIHMGDTSEHTYGPVTDYSIKMNMNNDSTRGWTWGVVGNTPIAALNTQGNLQIAGSITASNIGTMANDDKTISTSDPSGGSDGDVWFKV